MLIKMRKKYQYLVTLVYIRSERRKKLVVVSLFTYGCKINDVIIFKLFY